MNPKRKRHLTQQDLRDLGVRPGLHALRYPASGSRLQLRRLTSEAKKPSRESHRPKKERL